MALKDSVLGRRKIKNGTKKYMLFSLKSDKELSLDRTRKGGGYRDIRIAQIMKQEGIFRNP